MFQRNSASSPNTKSGKDTIAQNHFGSSRMLAQCWVRALLARNSAGLLENLLLEGRMMIFFEKYAVLEVFEKGWRLICAQIE